jgi:hypothetical protein
MTISDVHNTISDVHNNDNIAHDDREGRLGPAARQTVVAPVQRRLGALLLPWRGNIL